jgi:superfamily II DNA or RNA helicase
MDPLRGEVMVHIDPSGPALISQVSRDDISKRMTQCERQVLVPFATKVHLVAFRHRLIRSGVPEYMIGVYWGDTDRKERHLPLMRRIVLCTYKMAEEGLDVCTLNSMVQMMAHGSVDQLVGRIIRDKLHRSIQPAIVDLVDSWCACANSLWYVRQKTYRVYSARIEKTECDVPTTLL